MKNHSLKKQSSFLFVGSFSAYLIHFIFTLILVRVLPTTDYGIYQKFLLLSTTILALSGFGIVPSLYYFYPTASEKHKPTFIIQSALVIVFIGIIINCALFLFQDQLLTSFNMVDLAPFIHIVGFWVVINIFAALLNAIFVLNKLLWYNLFYNPIEKLVQAVIVLSFLLYTNDYKNAIWGLFTYNILKFIFTVFYILRNYPISNILRLTKERVFEQLKYSMPLWYGIVIITISSKLDKFIVNRHIDADQYAIYSIALSSIPLITIIFTTFNQVAIAKISTLMKSNSLREVGSLWSNIVNRQLSVTIPAILFFIIFAPEYIEIVFTKQYLAAVPYYKVFIISLLFISTSYGLILRGSNNTKKIFKANIISMLITLLVGIIIIPRYLLFGAIVTAALGIILPICIQVMFELKLIERRFFDWVYIEDIIKIILISLVSLLFVLPIKYYFSNIYILFSLSIILYSLIVILLEKQFNLFIYPDKLSNIFSKIINSVK